MDEAPLPEPIAALVAEVPGRVGLYARSLGDGRVWARDADRAFTAASVIKLLILAELYRRFAAGDLSPEEPVAVPAEAFVEGSGVLRHLHPGLEMTLRDLGVLMVIVSDNVASNLLIDRLGMDRINGLARALGLHRTALGRKFLGRPARPGEGENTISARDMGELLAALEQGRVIPESPLLDDLRGVLKSQQHRYLIPARLPEGTPVGNKTGGLPGIHHDAAIVYGPGAPLVVAILTEGLSDEDLGARRIAEIAEALYHAAY